MAAIMFETDYDYNNSIEETIVDLNKKIRSRNWLFLGLVALGGYVVYKRFM